MGILPLINDCVWIYHAYLPCEVAILSKTKKHFPKSIASGKEESMLILIMEYSNSTTLHHRHFQRSA